jgi:ABC-2 type transport system ATP-binding protein
VIDHGTVIASGTASELKARLGGEQLEVTLASPHPGAVAALAPLVCSTVQVSDDGRRLKAAVVPRQGMATAVIRALDAAGADVDDIEVHHPSLDDVFFSLTGRPAEPDPDPEPDSDDELVEVPA